jgi:hypothetical protein
MPQQTPQYTAPRQPAPAAHTQPAPHTGQAAPMWMQQLSVQPTQQARPQQPVARKASEQIREAKPILTDPTRLAPKADPAIETVRPKPATYVGVNRAPATPDTALKTLADKLIKANLSAAAHVVRTLLSNQAAITEMTVYTVKDQWLEKHYDVYAMLDGSPAASYSFIEGSVAGVPDAAQRGELSTFVTSCRPAFLNVWDSCINSLSRHGIMVLKIDYINQTIIVSKRDLADGWELRNDENRIADEENPENKVYGVVQNGIVADNKLVRNPIVNVYTFGSF